MESADPGEEIYKGERAGARPHVRKAEQLRRVEARRHPSPGYTGERPEPVCEFGPEESYPR